MKYILPFQNHAEYTATTIDIKPTVCMCKEENELHYNHLVKNNVLKYKADEQINLEDHYSFQVSCFVDEEDSPLSVVAHKFREGEGEVTFNVNIAKVYGNAFTDNLSVINLTEVTLPSSVVYLDDTWMNCSTIEAIRVMATTPPEWIGYTYDNLEQIIVPSESVDAYKSAEGWSDYASIITS